MRILQASSEMVPFSKTGGLADMVSALAKHLSLGGHQVGVVTPLYRGIKERFPAITPTGYKLRLGLGDHWLDASVWTLELPSGVVVYFIDQPELFDRASLYTEGGRDFADNSARFIFFSKAVTHLARHLPWRPELVHTHDWQVGLVPAMIRHQAEFEGWSGRPATCISIHNLAFQGNYPWRDYGMAGLPQHLYTPEGLEFYGGFSCLKAGIVYSDYVTTVSPRYAREITTREYGCGMEGVLQTRLGSMAGILNGVDYEEWRTEGNPFLPTSYDAEDLTGKDRNKAALQEEMGLPPRPDVPLFGNVGRLSDQKGIDLLVPALEGLLAGEAQFVLLGSGDKELEAAFRLLAAKHPEKVAAKIGFDVGLSHRIEAGSDFFVMPSKFEPCGLNQMYSLRYGAIPIVRATGGLDDSVVDFTEDRDRADGIKFTEISAAALGRALRKANTLYQHPQWMAHYRRNGMRRNFSWKATCDEYFKAYERAAALAAGSTAA